MRTIKIKQIKSKYKKYHTKLKRFFSSGKMAIEKIYGIHPVKAVLLAKKRNIMSLFVVKRDSEKYSDSIKEIINLYEKKYERSVVYVQNVTIKENVLHQGIYLECSPLVAKPINCLEKCETNELWVALDQIHDPHNFGAILRSCLFFGVDGIVSLEKSSCPLTPAVSKTSSGALEFLNICITPNLKTFIKQSKENGWHIIAASVKNKDQKEQPSKLTPSNRLKSITKPSILILGNEGVGIRKVIEDYADEITTIDPMHHDEFFNSLNVSVATGILLHQLTRSKKKGLNNLI